MRRHFIRVFASVFLTGIFSLQSCHVEDTITPLSDERIVLGFNDISIMRYEQVTKTTEVTSLSAAYVTALSDEAASPLFSNKLFTGSMSGMSSSDVYWPASDPGLTFYASNVSLSNSASGVCVSASNATDVVVAKLENPAFKKKNTLNLNHIFTRLSEVKVSAEDGYTVSNVSVTIVPKVSGIYNIDTQEWNSVVSSSASTLATSISTTYPELYMVPGKYVVYASWHSARDGYTEDITAQTAMFELSAGKKNKMELVLGGNAEQIKYRVTVAPWDEYTAYSGENELIAQPLTFEAATDGTILWKCSDASIARTVQYRKNGGEWTDWISTTEGAELAVMTGDIIELIGDNTEYATTSTLYNQFGGTAEFYVYGDLQSLMSYRRTLTVDACYSFLFRESKIKSLDDKKLILSATTLSPGCYQGAFYQCSLLQKPPVLPATGLALNCYNQMFRYCSALTEASELPATTVAERCYMSMYADCTSLVKGPSSLPATVMASRCYNQMFWNCSSLKTAPSLPATTMAYRCYFSMFRNCTSLTKAPEQLPATILAEECYNQMFLHCTSMTVAPEISATTLALKSCYNMFAECTGLITAPELSATTVAELCCYTMFRGCTSLTTPPSRLPATTLAPSCYQGMFYKCTALTSAPELPATTLAPSCYSGMFLECASLSSAPALPATTAEAECYLEMFAKCTSLTAAPELPAMILAESCYYSMFLECASLLSAPCLPATELAASCYLQMFYGCTSLTAAPELPATVLADSCYLSMFYGCTSLTTIGDIKATSLATACCKWMFDKCTSIEEVPALTIFQTTTLADECYYVMFGLCSSLRQVHFSLPATTMANACYAGLFRDCRNLEAAPALPATTLAQECYWNLFLNCVTLDAITCMATDVSATDCLKDWTKGIKATGTFTKNPTMSDWPIGIAGIPEGWTVQDSI